MDRIALISDLHGNIPAFEAVLDDIRERKIDRIICLGDLVGKGPSPDLAVDLARETCEAVILGNWDDMVTKASDYELVNWAKVKLGEERLKYIETLPFSMEFMMSGKQVRLLHASPQGIYNRIHHFMSKEKIYTMFENTELTGNSGTGKKPDIVGYGDIHCVFIMNFDELENRVLFNIGSVGNSLDSTLASYSIIEGKYGSEKESSFAVNFIRVPYDVEKAVHQAEISGMPGIEEYIMELRTACYRGVKK